MHSVSYTCHLNLLMSLFNNDVIAFIKKVSTSEGNLNAVDLQRPVYLTACIMSFM
jgi:hypothetical protein